MRRASLLIVVIVMLVGLVAFLGSQVPPVGAARPYEGQTIRAVVNAEYVKYSLSLVEKDLYDKLEDALDQCEDVGNVLHSIALKNA